MIVENIHSAAGQALGYVHQCMWALVELGRRANLDPAVELRLEALDDIQFDVEGSPVELLQTKHHTGSGGMLTANAVDIWRTLNVWMDLPNNENLILRFVTTRPLKEDSMLIHLRPGGNQDTGAAIDELMKVARDSSNGTTRLWREKFVELDPDTRFNMVRQIVIEDGSSSALEVDSELIKIFRYSCPDGQEQTFLQILKGWWYSISVRLLNRSLSVVTGRDLIVQIKDIIDQLKVDTLPIDPAVMEKVDGSINDTYKDRRFVQQLLWIAFDNRRLGMAIRDYHRSFTQRSFWLRNQLIGEAELDRFAFRLHDEWEYIFSTQLARMRRSGRKDSDIVGQEVLEKLVEESQSRLRDRFDERWFNRGMFHALADGELGYQIGWHPEFEAKLERLLISVPAH